MCQVANIQTFPSLSNALQLHLLLRWASFPSGVGKGFDTILLLSWLGDFVASLSFNNFAACLATCSVWNFWVYDQIDRNRDIIVMVEVWLRQYGT